MSLNANGKEPFDREKLSEGKRGEDESSKDPERKGCRASRQLLPGRS